MSQPLLPHRAKALGAQSSGARLASGVVFSLAAICVLVFVAIRGSPATELVTKDGFLTAFLKREKQSVLVHTHDHDGWKDKVRHGGLFATLNGLEHHRKAARRMWKHNQLKTITEPNSARLIKSLDAVEDRADHARSARTEAANLAGEITQWRKHDAAHQPQYAEHDRKPDIREVVPKFDSHVSKLMASLGEGDSPEQGKVHLNVATKTSTLRAQPQWPRPVSLSRALHHSSPKAHTSDPLAAVEKEIAQTREAAKDDNIRHKAQAAQAWEKGAKEAEKVEDSFSSAMRDSRQRARQSDSSVMKQFV